MLPDLDKIKSSEQGEVPLAPTLTTRARTALVLPKLGSASLISLGQLCDDGCSVVLRKKYLDVVKNGKVILKGTRNRQDKLWDIPIPQAFNSHPQTMKKSVIQDPVTKCSTDTETINNVGTKVHRISECNKTVDPSPHGLIS